MGGDARVPSKWRELKSTSVLDWDSLEPGMFRLGGRIDTFRLRPREMTLGQATVIHGPTGRRHDGDVGFFVDSP